MTTTALRRSRVIVVESQPIFGKALCKLLGDERELDVVCDARSVQAAEIAVHRPDLLIVDIDGCESSLDETVSSARSSAENVRIIVLTSQLDEQAMRRCVACGVEGYIVKDISPAEMARACAGVARGETYYDPRVAGGLLRRLRTKHRVEDELSPRETEIVRLIAAGLSNKEIGDRLCLSQKTVKNHVSRIFSKLQIGARTEAAIYAIRNGIA